MKGKEEHEAGQNADAADDWAEEACVCSCPACAHATDPSATSSGATLTINSISVCTSSDRLINILSPINTKELWERFNNKKNNLIFLIREAEKLCPFDKLGGEGG